MTAEVARFEMTFRPSPDLISLVRRFVSTVYERLQISRDLAAQIALTTHELLENATKYSTDGEATIRMEVRGPTDNPHISILTRNRVTEANAARVNTCLAELAKLGDPQAYYLQLMRRARHVTESGGLGLGRIAAEGDMDLSMRRDGEVLQLEAVHRRAAA